MLDTVLPVSEWMHASPPEVWGRSGPEVWSNKAPSFNSVSNPYSSNSDPDPAENLNPEPDPEDPWIRIQDMSQHYRYLSKSNI